MHRRLIAALDAVAFVVKAVMPKNVLLFTFTFTLRRLFSSYRT